MNPYSLVAHTLTAALHPLQYYYHTAAISAIQLSDMQATEIERDRMRDKSDLLTQDVARLTTKLDSATDLGKGLKMERDDFESKFIKTGRLLTGAHEDVAAMEIQVRTTLLHYCAIHYYSDQCAPDNRRDRERYQHHIWGRIPDFIPVSPETLPPTHAHTHTRTHTRWR